MFRLIKLILSLAALAGFVWFGANVPLGNRTLFGHLQAIGQTREAKELVEGTKESARPFVEEAGRRLAHRDEAPADKAPPTDSAPEPRAVPSAPSSATRPPSEEVSEGDKQALRKVIGSSTSARKPPRPAR